jgi:hypothetical protein
MVDAVRDRRRSATTCFGAETTRFRDLSIGHGNVTGGAVAKCPYY